MESFFISGYLTGIMSDEFLPNFNYLSALTFEISHLLEVLQEIIFPDMSNVR